MAIPQSTIHAELMLRTSCCPKEGIVQRDLGPGLDEKKLSARRTGKEDTSRKHSANCTLVMRNDEDIDIPTVMVM
jgi:hypothetical protein